MFTGRRYDPRIGLYYYRARYYHPEIGRFLQPDPIGYSGGLNLYAYCSNNPLNWVDPRGLSRTWRWRKRPWWQWPVYPVHAAFDIVAVPAEGVGQVGRKISGWFDETRPRDNFWGPVWDMGQGARDVYHVGAMCTRGAEGYACWGLAGLAGIPPGSSTGNPFLDFWSMVLSPAEGYFMDARDYAFYMVEYHRKLSNGLAPRDSFKRVFYDEGPWNDVMKAGEDFWEREFPRVSEKDS